ncbi:DUF6103 family protein [Pygmaiobacter massiliensis]|uniref:DUF6103 family protein n=1 Tax=Pygmaiobacter massiliensis TaxID=1917873 RepID=UPI00289B31C1|nr:DUF6103 family protein [Pygmaiobacter massiliensis]
MKKENITISMGADKLRATKRYMEKKDADVELELGDALQKLYEKYVPAPVREYIDEGGEDTPAPAKKQKEKIKSSAAANNGSVLPTV